MAKKRAGKITKVLTDSDVSPLNPKEQLSNTWFGRMFIADAEKSEIAKTLGYEKPGEYAIKVR